MHTDDKDKHLSYHMNEPMYRKLAAEGSDLQRSAHNKEETMDNGK